MIGKTILPLMVLSCFAAMGCNSRGPLPESSESERSPTTIGEEDESSNLSTQPDIEAIDQKVDEQNQYLADMKASQEQIEVLEASLVSLTSPATWTKTLTDLKAQYQTRDELDGKIRGESELVENLLSEARLALPAAIDRNLVVALETSEFKYNVFQQDYEGLTEKIRIYDEKTRESLAAVQTVGNFTFDALNANHFQEACPNGAINQFQGRSGMLVDRVVGVCGDDQLTAIGGVGGDLQTPRVCADGFVGKGIYGGAGDALDSVGLICAPESDLDGAQFTKLAVFGNEAGGTPYERFCPPRTVLVGLTGTIANNGDFLGSIFPQCQYIAGEPGSAATSGFFE
ncbi:hypothetical protein [Pseudobacteriovorax antillogorgiicola]|uniref:Uncharacterized protein n=1 Tax=Pseudobacteriovorax antillogorgiicola TaxID=1513793 RepID=A0A1Y6CFC2_9BACT|nr:hypothetical protein [Pseudobacteriovorax antillogorgiicola]TCS47242.1 hypothetical protein EDD56_12115 [Pseudobacteriovorax antillogorgiicola]SMF61997.1 hypothetical protein SAMN06296036_12115 [Pseudobacteriovorax antillogorgiicola]